MHDPRPPRSYFGYSQSPAKAQEALKEDEGEVEVEEDEGEERLFELAHEALGQREDEQELRKGQTTPWINVLALQLCRSNSSHVWNIFVLTGILMPIVSSPSTQT